MRSRTTVSSQPTSQQYTDSRNGTSEHGYSAWSRYPATPYNLSGGTRTIVTDDVVTPNWKSRIAEGEIICNPFKSVSTETRYSPTGTRVLKYYKPNGYVCVPHGTNHHLRYEEVGLARSPLYAFKEMTDSERLGLRNQVIDLAVTKANANIDLSSLLALATVAESEKTVQSVASILFRLVRIARNVRRLRFKALRKELEWKQLEDRYMELRYAIRPLYYEARGIVNALSKNMGVTRRTFRNKRPTEKLTVSDQISWTSHSYLMEAQWVRTTTYEVSAYAGVLCDVNLSQLSNFGADQLLETAWELTPFSFIFDWFLNFGDWIAAITPNAGVNKRASWVTVKDRYFRHVARNGLRSAPGSTGYIVTEVTLPDSWGWSEVITTERIANPAVASFAQLNVRLDLFKLTDLGIILRRLLT